MESDLDIRLLQSSHQFHNQNGVSLELDKHDLTAVGRREHSVQLTMLVKGMALEA